LGSRGVGQPLWKVSGAGTASLGAGFNVRLSGVQTATSMAFLELEEEERRDYRRADIMGERLFVTGLAPTVDDVRLYLAFQNCGKILEAHVAKPGLGYVLFEDIESADQAVDKMDREQVGGREIKVKRARGFYIRMEAEARRNAEKKQREREMLGAVLQNEIASRLRAAEEEHFAAQGVSVGEHLRSFDMMQTKKEILRELTQEAMNSRSVRRRGGSPEGMDNTLSLTGDRASFDEVHEVVGEQKESQGDYKSQLADQERIRKQAMMEIMVEGDKLSKAERSQSLDKTINMAQLIKERMDQIKRYEMLCENKELLGNITFTAAATPNSRTLVTDEKLAEERAAESGVAYSDGGSDSEDDGEEIDVTDDEVALINAIDQTHLEAQQRRLPSKVASPASAELSVHSDGREDMQRGRTATREKKSEVDLTGILHMGDAEFERLYAPAGRSRAGAAERGAKRLAKAKAACKNQPGGSQTSTAKVSSGGAAEGKPKRKRGRPPLTEDQKKRKPAYVPTGRPRGRPRKNA